MQEDSPVEIGRAMARFLGDLRDDTDGLERSRRG